MTSLALAPDAWAALAIAALAGAWLLRRGWRAVRASGKGSCCGKPVCGAGGPGADDLRRAAARGAARVNRGPTSVAR
jgi:hypothetical protein